MVAARERNPRSELAAEQERCAGGSAWNAWTDEPAPVPEMDSRGPAGAKARALTAQELLHLRVGNGVRHRLVGAAPQELQRRPPCAAIRCQRDGGPDAHPPHAQALQ